MELLSAMHQADLRLFNRVFRHSRAPGFISLARAVSRSGDGFLHVLTPALLWLLDVPAIGDFCAVLASALLVERCIYWGLKNSLRRRRPQEYMPGFKSLIVASDRFSFPSGHSSAAFLLATAACAVYGPPVAPMFLWAGSVAASRVVLGVHYPGDTLAGALMGSGIAYSAAAWLGLAG